MRKKVKFLFGICLIFLVGVILYKFFWGSNFEINDPYPKDYVELVIEDEIIDFKNHPLYQNGEVLLPLDLVKKYIDSSIAWQADEKKIIINTEDKIINMSAGSSTATVNDTDMKLNINPQIIDDVIYMPIEFLQDVYEIEVTYCEKTNIVVIDYESTNKFEVSINMSDVDLYENTDEKSNIVVTLDNLNEVTNYDESQKDSIVNNNRRWYHVKTSDDVSGYVKVPKKGLYIYQEPDKKSAVVWRANPVDKLLGFEDLGEWVRVRTLEGRLGYISKSLVNVNFDGSNEILSSDVLADDVKEEKINLDALEEISKGKLNITWHFVGEEQDVSSYPVAKGLDVIIPSFFDLEDKEGNLQCRATSEYVKWANSNGYKVWGLVKNDFEGKGYGSSDTRYLTSQILSDSKKRGKVIKQIISYANWYKLDGINLDFENMSKEDKDNYTLFVGELYSAMSDTNLTLSVDVGFPFGSDYYSLCYDRVGLSKVCDYVIVMAYDQYWASSKNSGSVAQYTWVESGVKNLLKEVPAKKLILGLPFYTRQWVEEINKDEEGNVVSHTVVNSIVLTMNQIRNIIDSNGFKTSWDEESGQYYVEWYDDLERLNKVWIEDEDSINKKASLVHKYSLAGVSSWMYGYESSGVWKVLNEVLKNQFNYNDWVVANKNKVYEY